VPGQESAKKSWGAKARAVWPGRAASLCPVEWSDGSGQGLAFLLMHPTELANPITTQSNLPPGRHHLFSFMAKQRQRNSNIP